jgi:glycerol-3-phosphate dehydrogenase
MASDSAFEVAVVGGGVVGCAVARALLLDGVRSVVLLEREDTICSGASGGNSGLLHTGFDATPGSLEARLVRVGYDMFQRLHAEFPVPLARVGAVVVAWSDEEAAALPGLLAKAHANGGECASGEPAPARRSLTQGAQFATRDT